MKGIPAQGAPADWGSPGCANLERGPGRPFLDGYAVHVAGPVSFAAGSPGMPEVKAAGQDGYPL